MTRVSITIRAETMERGYVRVTEDNEMLLIQTGTNGAVFTVSELDELILAIRKLQPPKEVLHDLNNEQKGS